MHKHTVLQNAVFLVDPDLTLSEIGFFFSFRIIKKTIFDINENHISSKLKEGRLFPQLFTKFPLLSNFSFPVNAARSYLYFYVGPKCCILILYNHVCY